MKDYQCIATELRPDGVLLAQLDRPEHLNAMNATLHAELAQFFGDVALDHEVRCVVLTGRGRAFSAGGDLVWLRDEVLPHPEVGIREAKKIVVDLLNLPQPIIAAVNGPATGFGLTMALMCDFAIVDRAARLGDPHVPIGLVAGDGGPLIWPMLAGMSKAKRYLLTGDLLDGAEAERIGLVTEACAQDEVLDRALAWAERMVSLPRFAVEGTKRTLNALLLHSSVLTLDLGFSAERVSQSQEEHAELIRGLAAKIDG